MGFDRRERRGDALEAMRVSVDGALAEAWTSLAGIVESFDAVKQTASVQPAIRARAQNRDGSYEWVELPLCLDCPVYFPSGGGVYLTFPVAKGDDCLLVFADRCIDAWWQSGGVQNQAEIRMHSLSDGFAFVGVSSVPRVAPGISTSAAELRNRDNDTHVSVNPAGTVDVLAKGAVTVRAATITATASGEATVTAAKISLNGQLVINGLPYVAHTHTGVRSGSDSSGGLS